MTLRPSKTVLVSMPWATTARPSLALGVLISIARQRGFDVHGVEATLDFAGDVGLDLYEYMSEKRSLFGLAEHLFSAHLFGHEAVRSDEMINEIFEAVRRTDTEQALPMDENPFMRIRDEVVPGFLDRTAERVLSMGPSVVGFSCTFNQVFPSLALARILKERCPDVSILFGGACVHGVMGEAYAEAFGQWIDHVFVGEADEAFVDFLSARIDPEQPRVEGVTYEGKLHGTSQPLGDMSWLPVPDFDDYFRERARLEHMGMGLPDCVNLPFESSRGCWWGAKNHCTFCGLNNEGMGYRSKGVEQTLHELEELSKRYGKLEFVAADNILQRDGFRTLLPRVRDLGLDLELFYEIKANVRRDEVAALAGAGVRAVQPGVESLSDNVLRLMNKGVTALQNVQMIKWTQEWGVDALYNILLGFEGETDADYEQMCGLMSRLFHLRPPGSPAIAQVHRFSPFHDDPERYGIRGVRPCAYYRHLAPPDRIDPERFAYFFDHELSDDAVCMKQLPKVREVLDAWQRSQRRMQAKLGPEFVVVTTTDEHGRSVDRLSRLEALIFVLTDAQVGVRALERALRSRGHTDRDAHMAALRRLLEHGYLVYQDGRLLSVVPYERPRRQRELDAWLSRYCPVTCSEQHSKAPRRLSIVSQSSEGSASSVTTPDGL